MVVVCYLTALTSVLIGNSVSLLPVRPASAAIAAVQVVHTGDALSPDAAVPGGSAGIIVDLFSHGQLLQQLTQV